MTTYYVELKRTVYYSGEFKADSQEEAENEVIRMAGGNPLDWEIVKSEEAVHAATYNR